MRVHEAVPAPLLRRPCIAGGGEGFRFIVLPGAGSTDASERLYRARLQGHRRGGPVLAGVGGGVYYEATKATSLVVEIHGLAGFPTFGVVTDVNFALQFNFYSETKPPRPAGRTSPRQDDEEPDVRPGPCAASIAARAVGGIGVGGRRAAQQVRVRCAAARPVAISQRIAPAA